MTSARVVSRSARRNSLPFGHNPQGVFTPRRLSTGSSTNGRRTSSRQGRIGSNRYVRVVSLSSVVIYRSASKSDGHYVAMKGLTIARILCIKLLVLLTPLAPPLPFNPPAPGLIVPSVSPTGFVVKYSADSPLAAAGLGEYLFWFPFCGLEVDRIRLPRERPDFPGDRGPSAGGVPTNTAGSWESFTSEYRVCQWSAYDGTIRMNQQ